MRERERERENSNITEAQLTFFETVSQSGTKFAGSYSAPACLSDGAIVAWSDVFAFCSQQRCSENIFLALKKSNSDVLFPCFLVTDS